MAGEMSGLIVYGSTGASWSFQQARVAQRLLMSGRSDVSSHNRRRRGHTEAWYFSVPTVRL